MKPLSYYYNKGKTDSLLDKYQPPHDITVELNILNRMEINHNSLENIAYTKGYFYVKGEKHRRLGMYEPPMQDEHKNAYDAGYYKKGHLTVVR